MKRIIIACGLAGFILASCSQNQPEADRQGSATATAEADTSYVASIDKWHAERVENLQKEDSWLALSGLYWLEPGSNTFGSDESNAIVFPEGKIAAQAGSFILEGEDRKSVV